MFATDNEITYPSNVDLEVKKNIHGIKEITYLHYDNLLRSLALVSFLFCGVYNTHLNVDLCDVLLAICSVRNACF